MKRIFTAILLLYATVAFAQDNSNRDYEKNIELLNDKVQSLQNDLHNETEPLNKKVKQLQVENRNLQNTIAKLDVKLSNTTNKLDSLQQQTDANNNAIVQASNELGIRIKETGKNSDARFTEVDQSLSRTSIYGITGVLSAILLSGLLYGFLFKRQSSDKSALLEKLNQTNTEVLAELNKTRADIEESIIKEFGKQTDLIDSQLQLLEQQKPVTQNVASIEPDHSLALKVASEINLIERNVSLMDPKTRGLKQLLASVRKLKDNLAANGYEMPELLGKQFHQGMKVIIANSVPDENLEKGSEVITKVLIPQVNFNDKMIQTAQIETAKGY